MAIANYLKLHSPRLKVLYATCEHFTNQMVESLSKGKLTPADFRNKYRNVDVLLIDDVQFLAKKQSTQVEFFNTFNALFLVKISTNLDGTIKSISILPNKLLFITS